MLDRLTALFLQIFPFPPHGTADQYAKRRGANPDAVAAVEKAVAAIATAKDDVTEELIDHARRMLEQEDQRQASVMGRAQSLSFAVALLSSLLSAGVGFLVTTHAPPRGEIFVITAFGAYVVVEIVLLVLNLVRAIKGIGYPRAGSSDVARWAGCADKASLYKDEAVCVLEWYRTSAHINTWRFGCLDRALVALRNIVIASAILVVAILVIANTTSALPCTDKATFHGNMAVDYSIECAVDRPPNAGK